jgi:beta-galactosidase
MMVKQNVAMLWANTSGFGNIEYAEVTVRNMTVRCESNSVILEGDILFSVPGRSAISRGQIRYQVFGDGTVRIRQTGRFSEKLPYWLPRYGYVLLLRDADCRLEYFGYGPSECYEDKISHGVWGRYPYVADDPFGAYEKPQESGSHCHTRWLSVQIDGQRLHISGDFSFGASLYDVHTQAASKHRKDMIPSEGMNLYIDYRMSGVGSASCGGQHPIPSCRINPGESFDFTVVVKPN